MNFITYSIRNFLKVGAVFPTLRGASKKIASRVTPNARVIVEYGCGDGAVTRELINRLSPNGRFLGAEISPEMGQKIINWQDPRIEITTSDAVELSKTLHSRFPDGVDAIVSGIPLSFLSDEQNETLLKNSAQALRPGGVVLIYQLSPQVGPRLKRLFHKVERGMVVVNIPPYFVYKASQPITRSTDNK